MTANDLYELFVGTIGIPRREFLYEIRYWEARRIAVGYTKRSAVEKQLQRLTAYSVYFMFRENPDRKTPSGWFPFAWEKEGGSEEEGPSVGEEERKRLQELIRQENMRLGGGR